MGDLSMQQWRKSKSSPQPQIWCKFESKLKNGKMCKIRIEDLTSDRYDEILNFMLRYYFTDEPVIASSKLLEDEESVIGYLSFYQKVMKENVSIIAVLDEDTLKPEIVGVQLLSIVTKSDPPLPQFSGKKTQLVMQFCDDLKKNVNLFYLIKSDAYLNGRGLCVKPEYRGSNIAYNIFLTLEKLARAFQIAGCVFLYSSIQAQILAERVGFKVYNEIAYDEYKNENGEVIFPVKGHKSLKLVVIVYK